MLNLIVLAIAVGIMVFIMSYSIILARWKRCRKVDVSPAKALINSINRKEEQDNLEDMIEFLKENPNIKYHINKGRNCND